MNFLRARFLNRSSILPYGFRSCSYLSRRGAAPQPRTREQKQGRNAATFLPQFGQRLAYKIAGFAACSAFLAFSLPLGCRPAILASVHRSSLRSDTANIGIIFKTPNTTHTDTQFGGVFALYPAKNTVFRADILPTLWRVAVCALSRCASASNYQRRPSTLRASTLARV